MTDPAPKKDLTGKAFERLVAAVQKKLDPGSAVEWDVKIQARSGAWRQIDVIRGTLGGADIGIAIEAKDRSEKVNINMVGDFYTSFTGIGAQRGIMVSNLGFTRDALLEAKDRGIETCVLRPAKDEDWRNRIRYIATEIILRGAACEDAELLLVNGERVPVPSSGDVPVVDEDGAESEVIDIVLKLLEKHKEIEGQHIMGTINSPRFYLDDGREIKAIIGRFRYVEETGITSLTKAPHDWVFEQYLPDRVAVEETSFFKFSELEKLADEFRAKKRRAT
jgi:hypothetical protein